MSYLLSIDKYKYLYKGLTSMYKNSKITKVIKFFITLYCL